MATTIFEFVTQDLEDRSDLDKLEARGTVRLALKASGLDAQSVTSAQMLVMIEKVLPGELQSRGVANADGVCDAMAIALKGVSIENTGRGATQPEDVFRRLGGR
jgi:hypothetical protein